MSTPTSSIATNSNPVSSKPTSSPVTRPMPHIKKGVLLVNLGTPDSPTPKALRRYLAEFLSDPRLVEMPRWQWLPILYGLILPRRPQASAKKYQTIWTEEGSPLLVISQNQAKKLQAALPKNYQVELAMRYGHPSLDSGLTKLIDLGVEEIIIFPLYPQYSAVSTGTVMDKVGEVLKTKRYFPALRFLGAYYTNPLYLKACQEQILHTISSAALDSSSSLISLESLDKIVFSYHGVPQAMIDKGDPYYNQCFKTTELIAKQMGLPLEKFATVFQSRFGREEWTKPYASDFFKEAPKNNIKNIAVFCPGFSADCLETLEEMGDENYEEFMNAGGESYLFIPSLNETDRHLEMMVSEILAK